MQEGIQLPTIVVVGDQSSRKSSVLESLAQISLPRAQGISMRVLLIMRLKHHSDPTPQLHLEYHDKKVTADGQQNDSFLMEEIRVLEEAKGIGLPNFLPQTAFLICQLNL
ncbi:dynamin-related protein 4C [Artemisia annua]|uniref:Dynamin-related protein 4C n=1 Tax=Artemisia annua TaxID=35608 RepID=A0A2U1N0W8_ARTAN|nr:dynamin-related protein 4C [Artemisia annua]